MSEANLTDEIPAHVVYVWEWWCEGSQRWERYASDWPSEQWARRHHPCNYNAIPEGHVLRLTKRTTTIEVLPS